MGSSGNGVGEMLTPFFCGYGPGHPDECRGKIAVWLVRVVMNRGEGMGVADVDDSISAKAGPMMVKSHYRQCFRNVCRI